MAELTRRDVLKGAAIASAAAVAGLAGCAAGAEKPSSASASSGAAADALAEIKAVLGAEAGSNFGIYREVDDLHGTTPDQDTLANLNSAMTGETGATTKYAAFAKKAEEAGLPRIAKLFEATSKAEDLHRNAELEVALKLDSNSVMPDPPEVSPTETDGNLIAGARGEIYETADMYPIFIKKAQEEAAAESDKERQAVLQEAVEVFTRAKLAEAYHAKWYMDAYTTIDTPTDEPYWLCEFCGFIHKGAKPAVCPICGVTEFKEY